MVLRRIDSHKQMYALMQDRGVAHMSLFAKKMLNMDREREAEVARLEARGKKEKIQEFVAALDGGDLDDDIQEIFDYYCNFGERERKFDLSRPQFFKLIKECRMIDERLDHSRVDLNPNNPNNPNPNNPNPNPNPNAQP